MQINTPSVHSVCTENKFLYIFANYKETLAVFLISDKFRISFNGNK